MLYQGNKAKEGSQSYDPGIYKFKVVAASVKHWQEGISVNYELKTWSTDGKDGPKILDSLRLNSESKAMKEEIDRRLTIMLGKPELEREGDLLNSVGYVCLRKGPKYLEPMTFGGYFDKDKKSATGNSESILAATKAAIEYDYKQDQYVMNKLNSASPTPETDDDQPF
jgi:hypothetical protein